MFSFTPYVIPNRDFIFNGKRLKILKRPTFAIPEFRSEIEGFLDIKPFLVLFSFNIFYPCCCLSCKLISIVNVIVNVVARKMYNIKNVGRTN
jgi:hypothetical protein